MMNCLGLPVGVRLAIKGRLYNMRLFSLLRLCPLFASCIVGMGSRFGLIYPFLRFPYFVAHCVDGKLYNTCSGGTLPELLHYCLR